MNFPDTLHYTKEHEWVKLEDTTATVGITEFAQGELGDIVYVDIDSVGKSFDADAVFGTVEAVKTVSDLFLPLSGKIDEVNPALANEPELINSDPYEAGWMIKMTVADINDFEKLLTADAYRKLIA